VTKYSPPRLPRVQVQVQGEQRENISSSYSSPSSSDDLDPTIVNSRNQIKKILREIYEKNDDMDQQAHLSLLSYQPIYLKKQSRKKNGLMQ
jgi:hypothetical protein